MSNINVMRVTASTTLAVEATRVVLAQHSLISGIDLSGSWSEMQIETGAIHDVFGCEVRRVYVTFRLHGYDTGFFASWLVRKVQGTWSEASGSISPYGNEGEGWDFHAKLEENKIVTELR